MKPQTEVMEMELCEMIAISDVSTNLEDELQWIEEMDDDDR